VDCQHLLDTILISCYDADEGGARVKEETRTTLRIPEDLKEKLRAEAEKQNRSLHNLIITILRDYFANR